MTRIERAETLQGECSIKGGTVYNNEGHVWGEFETHEAAKIAVDAYRAGLDRGIEIGKRMRSAEIKALIGA